MEKIKVAIIGVGNCASSLIQGIHHYKKKHSGDCIGLMHWRIGQYEPGDIEVVAAFDIDSRKVNKDISDAIFADPNCTKSFNKEIPPSGVIVTMGKILDGISEHMKEYEDRHTFSPAKFSEPDMDDIVQILKHQQAQVLLNYLPVGSESATRFYTECALEANVAFINNMPSFIASDPDWANRFKQKGLPLIGDDIKSQIGATIIHRVLVDLFKKRGVKLEHTYQLNTGGNTDFLNMLNKSRLKSKKESKTEAVQSIMAHRLNDEDIHIGPSDYIPWQKDNKICFLRIEGRIFGDVPMNLELRLSVEDAPNSAGVTIDAIRCVKLALDAGLGGVLLAPSSFFCKHPPMQYTDDEAYSLTEEFIKKYQGADSNF